MNPVLLAALVGAAGAIIGALTTLFVQSRRLPADIRLTHAQADKTEHEASALIIDGLSAEVGRLKGDIVDIREQLARSVDAEVRAAEYRRATVAIGEGRDRDRERARQMAETLMEIIGNLLDCLEDSTRAKEIDRTSVVRMVQFVIDSYMQDIAMRK